jgi:hypothetical protein
MNQDSTVAGRQNQLRGHQVELAPCSAFGAGKQVATSDTGFPETPTACFSQVAQHETRLKQWSDVKLQIQDMVQIGDSLSK